MVTQMLPMCRVSNKLDDNHFLSLDDSFPSLVEDNATYEFLSSVEDVTHEVSSDQMYRIQELQRTK